MALDKQAVRGLVERFRALEARAAVLQAEYKELDTEAAAIRVVLRNEDLSSLDELPQEGLAGQSDLPAPKLTLAERVVEVLRKMDGPASPARIAEAIGGMMTPAKTKSLRGKVNSELTKLIRGPNASVVRTGRARYELKEKGPAG